MDVRSLVLGDDVGPRLREGIERLTGLRATDSPAGATLFVGREPPRPVSDLAWVHAPMAGVDRLVAEHAPWPERTLLTRTVGMMADRMAEYVVGWTLAGHLHVAHYADAGRWAVWEPRLPVPLAGSRAVVAGAGAIGGRIAAALSALGVAVHGVARRARGGAQPPFASMVDHLDALPGGGFDLVVDVLPHTPATRGVFGDAAFEHLRPRCFVNVGRGATVDLAALLRALDDGRVGRAVLDVFEHEPLPAASPAWRHPRLQVTPHVSGPTTDDDVVADLERCWRAVAAGERPALAVDVAAGY